MNKNIKSYLELAKPRIIFSIIITTIFGYLLALDFLTQNFSLTKFTFLIIGTALSAGGAGALNNFLERDSDAKMIRTKNRPIPSGTIQAHQALTFGIILTLTGTGILVNYVNLLTGFLALLTTFLYVLVYTPLKKITWLNTVIGAIPGAIPPLGGWAAVMGTLSPQAWILFLILFIWQHPHFYAIAWMYKEDYKRGGYKMLPVVEPSGRSTFWHVVAYSFLLLPVSLLPSISGMTGLFYFLIVLISSLYLIKIAIEASRTRSVIDARRVLKATILFLPLLLITSIIDINLKSYGYAQEVEIQKLKELSLPKLGKLDSFRLTDQEGSPFTVQARQNEYTLISLFFTNCKGICPKIFKELKSVKDKISNVNIVSISVDPEFDNIKVIKKYREENQINWPLLTGEEEKIKEILAKKLKLGFTENVADHSTRITLVDKEGNIRKYYDGLNEDVGEEIIEVLR